MSLDALKVALQGLFPLSPISAAVQGLIEELNASNFTQAAGSAKSHVNRQEKSPNFDAYVRMMNAEFERKSRIEKDDRLAAEFIAALVQMEILHG